MKAWIREVLLVLLILALSAGVVFGVIVYVGQYLATKGFH